MKCFIFRYRIGVSPIIQLHLELEDVEGLEAL
jgi:hypothetical protein